MGKKSEAKKFPHQLYVHEIPPDDAEREEGNPTLVGASHLGGYNHHAGELVAIYELKDVRKVATTMTLEPMKKGKKK